MANEVEYFGLNVVKHVIHKKQGKIKDNLNSPKPVTIYLWLNLFKVLLSL